MLFSKDCSHFGCPTEDGLICQTTCCITALFIQSTTCVQFNNRSRNIVFLRIRYEIFVDTKNNIHLKIKFQVTYLTVHQDILMEMGINSFLLSSSSCLNHKLYFLFLEFFASCLHNKQGKSSYDKALLRAILAYYREQRQNCQAEEKRMRK